MVVSKHTQAEAGYGRGDPIFHCGICVYYQTPHRCTQVMGNISPFGTCDILRADNNPFGKTLTPRETQAVRAMAADAADRSGQVMEGSPMADFGSLSAAQINAGMGFGPGGVGDQSQALLNSNFGNFGSTAGQYAPYPSFGEQSGAGSIYDPAAYATGRGAIPSSYYDPGTYAPSTPIQQYNNGGYNPYDPGTYAPSAQGNVGSQSSAQAAALRANFLANGGDSSVFNDRWGGMPSTYTPDYGNLQNIPQGIFNGNFLRQQSQQPMFDYFSPQTFAPSAQPNTGSRTPTAPAMGSLFDQGSYQQGPPPVTDQQRQQGIDMLLRMNNPNTGVGSG